MDQRWGQLEICRDQLPKRNATFALSRPLGAIADPGPIQVLVPIS
jgi:hypothetical protein